MDRKKIIWQIAPAAVLLLIAAVFYGFNLIKNQKPAVSVEIAVDGQVVETLDLRKNTEIVIPGASGGSNTLVIQDQKAWVTHASCPDQICVQQGKISLSGELIVCLPNKMVATVVGED